MAHRASFGKDALPGSDEEVVLSVPMRLFLFGDFKFLFAMMGRWGYESHHCMHCRLSAKQFKEKHQQCCECKGEPWTVAKLTNIVAKQKQTEGHTAPSVAPEMNAEEDSPCMSKCRRTMEKDEEDDEEDDDTAMK